MIAAGSGIAVAGAWVGGGAGQKIEMTVVVARSHGCGVRERSEGNQGF